MQAGDILLFRRGSLISKIIQWGTNSPYSHVAICVDPDKNLLIEAQGIVRANDIRRVKDYDIFRVKQGYIYDLDDVISYLVDKLNSNYDYLGVIYLGLLKLFQMKKTANAWQKKKDYFCSELLSGGFEYGGLDIAPQIEDDVTSPGDIADSEIIEKID